jgi:hypothetical protein
MLEKLWFLSGVFENEPEIQDYGHSLIEMIMAKGSNRLKGANVSGKHVLELKAMSDKASKSLEMGSLQKRSI